jgi:hypothetical protein
MRPRLFWTMYFTIQLVIERCNREGIPISKRTLEYYQRLELLPKPEKKVGARGRGVLSQNYFTGAVGFRKNEDGIG